MRRFAPLIILASVLPMIPSRAAAPIGLQPPNDHFANAQVISSLSQVVHGDNRNATRDLSDPTDCFSQHSVWYKFTAERDTEILVKLSAEGVGLYWGTSASDLHLIGCDGYAGLTAGETVYIEVGDGFDTPEFLLESGAEFDIQVDADPSAPAFTPPLNDSIQAAFPIPSLPYSATVGLRSATVTPDEPGDCYKSSSLPPDSSRAGTAWYTFTPTVDETLLVTTFRHFGAGSGVGVFSLGNGVPVRIVCSHNPDSFDFGYATFDAHAGSTYALQLWGDYGGDGTSTDFRLAPIPTKRLEVSDLTVDQVGAVATISAAFVIGDPATGVPEATLHFEACPVDPLDNLGCSELATWAADFGGPATRSLTWLTAGCVGDFDVRVWVDSPDARPQDPARTTQARRVSLYAPAGTAGAGRCSVAQAG